MYGYLRINIQIDSMRLKHDKLNIDNNIKFYFWVNVGGICQMIDPKTGAISSVFENYTPYVDVNNKASNGFKIMNDVK